MSHDCVRVYRTHAHAHEHIAPRKMHAMREIFLRYLKIVRVLHPHSLQHLVHGFLFEVFRLKNWIVDFRVSGNFYR